MRMISDDTEEEITSSKEPATKINSVEKCPECGAELVHENGCVSCKNCGYSKCG